jgi:hypothetical protein
MIPPSLKRLEACHVALIAALDSDEIEAIESSVAEFKDALEAVRARGSWRDSPELADLVLGIYHLSEAARIRVNFLTDVNQRRIETLANMRGQIFASPYGRDGRQAA